MADADKVAFLGQLDREARRLDPRVRQVMASLSGIHEVILILNSNGTLAADVHEVPAPLDAEAARLELAAIGVRIDALTPAQSAYLDSWRIGS